MAAGTLPAPGTKYGPCKGKTNCAHRDCTTTRIMATAFCVICSKLIGYNTRFYRRFDEDQDETRTPLRDDSGREYTLVHADCAERESESGGR